MDSYKVDMFLLNKSSLFQDSKLPQLRDMLIEANDDCWDQINSASFKNPSIALILSCGAGCYGADRFYLGQPLLGVGKLLMTIFLIGWYIAIGIEEIENWAFLIFGLVVLFSVLFWYIIDVFLVSKTAKEFNYNTLLTILN